MNKILLITTKGCAACTIMERLIKEAIDESHRSIALEIKDVKDANASFLHKHKTNDFPTTYFIKDNDVKFQYVGTNAKIVILRWIDVYFK